MLLRKVGRWLAIEGLAAWISVGAGAIASALMYAYLVGRWGLPESDATLAGFIVLLGSLLAIRGKAISIARRTVGRWHTSITNPASPSRKFATRDVVPSFVLLETARAQARPRKRKTRGTVWSESVSIVLALLILVPAGLLILGRATIWNGLGIYRTEVFMCNTRWSDDQGGVLTVERVERYNNGKIRFEFSGLMPEVAPPLTVYADLERDKTYLTGPNGEKYAVSDFGGTLFPVAGQATAQPGERLEGWIEFEAVPWDTRYVELHRTTRYSSSGVVPVGVTVQFELLRIRLDRPVPDATCD